MCVEKKDGDKKIVGLKAHEMQVCVCVCVCECVCVSVSVCVCVCVYVLKNAYVDSIFWMVV